MKKIIYIFGFCISLAQPNSVEAQLMSGQATENSTLIFNGSTIGIKPVKDGEVAFSYVNSPLRSCNSGMAKIPVFTGVFLNAKNQEGLAGVFSEGKFQPSARATGVIGLKINLINNYDQLECNYIQARKPLIGANQKIGEKVLDYIKAQLISQIGNPQRQQILRRELNKIIDNNPIDEWKNKIVTSSHPADATEVAVIAAIAVGVQALIDTYDVQMSTENAAAIAFDAVRNLPVREIRLFFFLRQRADQFHTLDSIIQSKPLSSFTKRYFNRTEWGLGANLTLGGRVILGVNYGGRSANNLPTLAKTDYSLKNTIVSGTQQVVEERKQTAYLGKYQVFKQSFFYADLLYIANTGANQIDASPVNLLLNPYIRYDKSRDKSINPDITTIGITMLYQSRKRFIGGLYVEAFDIRNHLEKFDARASNREPDLSPLHNRLSFGIITQFEIQSILKR